MQKASIGKILLALVISCVYIYLFGIVQVVHVSADNEREIEVSIPEATTSAETEKTPETPTIKLQDDKKPTLADVKAQTTATTKAETTTSTTTVKKRTPAPAADNTVIIPEPQRQQLPHRKPQRLKQHLRRRRRPITAVRSSYRYTIR